jgi:WD40 repeat protein
MNDFATNSCGMPTHFCETDTQSAPMTAVTGTDDSGTNPFVAPLTAHATGGGAGRDSQSPSSAAAAASRSIGGKITVYLETRQAVANKIITVNVSTNFGEFESLVSKKFGQRMEMIFHMEDDRISLDDDDSLEMFLSAPSKKHKLFCTPFGTQQAERSEDNLTSVAATGTGGTGAGAHTTELARSLVKSQAASQEFHREERTYTGHAAAVYCCAFAPGGDMFVTASRDKSVRVWKMNGEHKVMTGGHSGFVLSCDFSPNSEFVVSSSDDMKLKIWNARTGEKKHVLKGHGDKVYWAKFNPTGAYVVSGSCDRTVRVWNADNGSHQATLKGHSMAVFSVGFSRMDNGKHIVSASDDRTVKIWDWREGKELRTLEGHTGTIWSCEFSHTDRQIVSASMDREIKLWDVATGQPIRNFPGHLTPIHHAIFTTDDRFILSCARDWTVKVWDVETGKHVDTLSGHGNTVYHLDIQGDKLLTCSLDESVKLWNLTLPPAGKSVSSPGDTTMAAAQKAAVAARLEAAAVRAEAMRLQTRLADLEQRAAAAEHRAQAETLQAQASAAANARNALRGRTFVLVRRQLTMVDSSTVSAEHDHRTDNSASYAAASHLEASQRSSPVIGIPVDQPHHSPSVYVATPTSALLPGCVDGVCCS